MSISKVVQPSDQRSTAGVERRADENFRCEVFPRAWVRSLPQIRLRAAEIGEAGLAGARIIEDVIGLEIRVGVTAARACPRGPPAIAARLVARDPASRDGAAERSPGCARVARRPCRYGFRTGMPRETRRSLRRRRRAGDDGAHLPRKLPRTKIAAVGSLAPRETAQAAMEYPSFSSPRSIGGQQKFSD